VKKLTKDKSKKGPKEKDTKVRTKGKR